MKLSEIQELHYSDRLFLRSILTPPKWEGPQSQWENSGFWKELKVGPVLIPVAPRLL